MEGTATTSSRIAKLPPLRFVSSTPYRTVIQILSSYLHVVLSPELHWVPGVVAGRLRFGLGHCVAVRSLLKIL
jgi:hypothetical protein